MELILAEKKNNKLAEKKNTHIKKKSHLSDFVYKTSSYALD